MKIKRHNNLMLNWAKELFPICRSLTGKGIQYSLRYFQKINPELKLISFKSGTKIYDWEIPLEWNIKNSYIQHLKTKKKIL